MMYLGKKSLIEHVIDRCLKSFHTSEVVLATTTEPEDAVLAEFVTNTYGINVVKGSNLDVRSRFVQIIDQYGCEYILRVTADDPFKDPRDFDLCKRIVELDSIDYCCNFSNSNLPIGMDVEGFTAQSLLNSVKNSNSNLDREHVTPNLRESSDYRRVFLVENRASRAIRLTVDTPEDLELCNSIVELMDPENYDWQHTLNCYTQIAKKNRGIL